MAKSNKKVIIRGYLIGVVVFVLVFIKNWQGGDLKAPSSPLARILSDPTALAVILGLGLFAVLVVVVLIWQTRRVSGTDYVQLFDDLAKAQGQNYRAEEPPADEEENAADSDLTDEEVEGVVVVPDVSVPEAERVCGAFAKHGLQFKVVQRYIDNGFHGRYNSNYGMGTRMQIAVHPADFEAARQLSIRLLGG